MVRSILAVTAVLAVLVGCRDGPSEPIAPVVTRAASLNEVMVSSQVVRTVVDLLDDPFVRELQDAVGAPTNSLYHAVRNASRYGTADDILTLSRVLTDTRRRLIASANHVEDDPDGVILRAELELMLDDVAMLLEPPPQSEQGKRERDVVQR